MQGAVRLIFEYDGNAVRLVLQQPVDVAVTGFDDLEIAAAEYIDWFNFRRLHGEIGLVPPVEYETTYRSTLPEQPAQRELEVSIKPGT